MTVNVYINPDYANTPQQKDNGGIRRVISAMAEHLHKFDINVVHNPNDADVINNHGGALVEVRGTPMVNSCHGLYWSRQPWGDGFYEVNKQVVESMCRSDAWTAPSDWVNQAMRRGGYFYPVTVYHGVNPDEFLPSKTPGNYILWNKLRQDYVSNPDDMQRLAARMQNRSFVSTIGSQTPNVSITGAISYEAMHKLVAEAGVYLSTVRETFGIGILEALACGVPVAAFDWGGNSEILSHGYTGYLAPPGDFVALAECVERCFSERDRLSRNAVSDVRARWTWEPRIEQYANIFKRVHDRFKTDIPKVSIILTAYKLDTYLPACLDSVQAQTYPNFECLVIDDAQLKSTETIVRNYAVRDPRIRYIPTPNNFGLPGARNFGCSQAKGHYIRHLDADDYLAPNALELEVAALDKDRGTDIVYGHLEVVREDGTRFLDKHQQPIRGGWPPEQFDWHKQMSHMNQIPSCAMARREVFERVGGYRERMKRNEDAEFWCRATSLGLRAKKFTQAVTYFHRERNDSKGALEWKNEGGEPDWTAWFPWRAGAANSEQARKLEGQIRLPYIVPFGAQGKPPDGMKFWYVHDYAYPVVSVIVTCGPGHKHYLIDALDSVQAQTFPDWECLVVNDTGEEWNNDIPGAPWARVINLKGNQGTSKARNAGFRFARGRYIVWLDADDYWLPWFLEKMVGYAEVNDGVIFSDLIALQDTYKVYRYDEFDPQRLKLSMRYPGSSVLYPRNVVQAVFDKQGGYDTEIPGMEDWDFQYAVHDLGFCAYHIDEPLFVYRMLSSTKREKDYNKIELIRAYMDKKWSAYRKGEKPFMCGCQQPKKKPSAPLPASTLNSSGNFSADAIKTMETSDQNQMVMLEYIGPMEGTFSIRSRVDKTKIYRFGNNPGHKARAVFLGDAELLTSMMDGQGNASYRIVNQGGAGIPYDPIAFLGQPISS